MGDTVRKIKEVILRKMLLKAVFAWYRRKPIREDLVLFAYDRDGFTDNMQAVRDELEERGSYAFVNLTGSTKMCIRDRAKRYHSAWVGRSQNI